MAEAVRTPLLPLLAAFAALCAVKLYAVRFVAFGDANPLHALGLEAGFVVLALSLVALLPRGRVWGWLAVDALVSVLCVVAIVFVGQFDEAPTLGALGVARELGPVSDSVTALLGPAYLLFFIDVVILAVVFALRARRGAPQAAFDRRVLAVIAASLVWVAVVVGSLHAAGPIDDSLAGAREKGMLAYALFTPPSNESVTAPASSATVPPKSSGSGKSKPRVQKVVDLRSPVDLHDPAAVQARFDLLQNFRTSRRTTGAPEPAATRGKSIIIIQVESLSDYLIGLKVDGQEVTPNLNRLAKTSYYAPRTVTQIGRGNTADAEFTANTSLMADKSGPASYTWGGKKLPSLPRVAIANGYEAMTFHPNYLTFWRRDLMYPSLGFSKWYVRRDFPNRDIIGVGPSDKVLFSTAAEVLEGKHEKHEKFLAEVVTLSSHFPYYFGAPHGRIKLDGALANTTPGEYVRAVNYADEQLGAFIERLRADGLWDDTVVMIYGDHFGIRPYGYDTKLSASGDKAVRHILGRDPLPADSFAVPLIVHVPGQTTGNRIEQLRAQVDIMPTVADLLGFDLSSTPHIGTSIFSANTRMELLRYYCPDGTFATDDYLFRPGIGYDDATVVRLSDGKSIPRSAVPKYLYQRVHLLSALNRNYLRSLPSRHWPRTSGGARASGGRCRTGALPGCRAAAPRRRRSPCAWRI